jgi:hypothetical protein
MAVSYHTSSVFNSGSTTTSSVVIDSPPGVVPDDYLIIAIAYTGGTGVTITAPTTTWQLVSTSNTGTTYGVQTFRRHSAAAEPPNLTFTLSSAQYVSAILVAYSGMRIFGSGGSFFPQGAISAVDGSGSTTTSNNIAPNTVPGYEMRWVASYNTTAAVTVTSPGTGLTTRADTSTTAGSFIQLALTDGITTNRVLTATPIPGATLSGSTTNNKMIYTMLRQDQTQIFSPEIDYVSSSSVLSATSGTIIYGPSMPNEQAVLVAQIANASTGAALTSVTMPGTLWTLQATSQNPSNNTRTEIWTATLPQAATNYTATWTSSSAAILRLIALAFPAAGPVTNIVTAAGDSGNPSASIVTKGNNSKVYGFITDTNGFVSSGSSPSLLHFEFNMPGTGNGTARMLEQTNTTAGTTITEGLTYNTPAAWSMILFEVAPPQPTGQMLHMFN